MLKRTIYVAKLLYTPASFLCIFYFAWLNREILIKIFAVADSGFLVAAVFLWGLLHLLAPLSPKIFFASLGTSIPYTELLTIYLARLPARYLPGGIWHTVGRLADYHQLGISKNHLALLALVDTFFPCLTTMSLGGGLLWFTGDKNLLFSLEVLPAIISLCALILIPFTVKRLSSSPWGKNFLFYYSLLTLLSILFWLIASISFLFYYSSVSFNMTQLSLLQVAATYIFSWGVGYISVFAPQGIGVFEIVAGKLLTLPMTLGGAVAFLAGFRMIALAADSIAWLIYRILLLISSKQSAKGIKF